MNREYFIERGWPILEVVEYAGGKVVVFVGSETGMQEALKYDSLQEFKQEMLKHDRGWEL